MKVKVLDHENLIKDTVSKAVINTDSYALDKARRRQALAAEKTNEIEQLKDDVAEIKSLLKQLLDR